MAAQQAQAKGTIRRACVRGGRRWDVPEVAQLRGGICPSCLLGVLSLQKRLWVWQRKPGLGRKGASLPRPILPQPTPVLFLVIYGSWVTVVPRVV